jgi:nitroreductase
MTTAPPATHTLLDAIRNRRSFSLKQLSSAPVDLAMVQVMLDAANWAPSHGKTEPWRFVVYSGAGRQGLSDAFGAAYRQLTPVERRDPVAEQGQRDRVWQAPVWISLSMAPALNGRGEPAMPEWEEIVAFGSAVQNAHLVGASLGLACKWTSNPVATHDSVAAFVGLVPPGRLFGFLYVGYPAEPWPEGARRPVGDKVRWVAE